MPRHGMMFMEWTAANVSAMIYYYYYLATATGDGSSSSIVKQSLESLLAALVVSENTRCQLE